MRILHYFLGFPPYRTGGLTKYAYDLMQAQVKDDNTVFALWPGEIKKMDAEPVIKKRKKITGVVSYELINPLPVSLDEGINNFGAFTRPCNIDIYKKFLGILKPDVVHIHTLMGLHKEFISAAQRLKIRTVFTSHDYFGLCPKVTLYRYGQCCDNDHGCTDCIQCNVNALSLSKIRLMQSPIYRQMKNTAIVKILRKRHRSIFFAEEVIPEMPKVKVFEMAEQYRKLRAYYIGMYEAIDTIHFNSSLTKKIYERYLTPHDSRVISIMHKEIGEHQDNLHIPSDKLRILCLAPAKPFKGYNVLKSALDKMWNSGNHNFELKIFSPVPKEEPYMIVKEDGYSYTDLPIIFSNTDVLVAPSVWYETFGFTILEALSYGVPVIVSDHVGAKDIIGNAGIVVPVGNEDALIKAFNNIERGNHVQVKKWNDFLEENELLYR